MTSRKRRAERGRVWAQEWAAKHGPACPNCGEPGPHFAPPGFGSPGTFICKPPEHDPRCISLTDSEFNDICDCRTLAAIDRTKETP